MTNSMLYTGTNPTSYFGQNRTELLPLIPLSISSILDIGCASGGLGATIKARQKVRYCGIDLDALSISRAKTVLDDALVGDVSSMAIPYARESFEVLIFADILEHLAEPEKTLQRWLPVLQPNGLVVVSLPNIRHFTVTLPLLLNGKWEYQDRGIMDETHLRFFTRQSARTLLTQVGLRVESETPHLRYVYRLVKLLDLLTLHHFREHIALQWMFVARKPNAEVQR